MKWSVKVTFIEKLTTSWQKNNSLLCVGLDPAINRFPRHLQGKSDAIYTFCKGIVDATADLVCAFKPQIAYFAAEKAEDQLEAIITYIHEQYPNIPVLLDAKRGDIGATAKQYAREAFERFKADAVTLSPYMGYDSVEPYFEYPDRGTILLARTSNPGGSDLQFLNVQVSGKTIPLYQYVAHLVAEKWNVHGQCGLVVGATFPAEIVAVRKIVGEMPLLIPGIGAQGGDIQATVTAGKTSKGMGMMINSSRAILYAGEKEGEDFARFSRNAAIKTRDEINRYRE